MFRPIPNLSIRDQQETPSDELGTPGADAAREAARKSISEMSMITSPVQSPASAVSGTDPISLIDWISSFLKTLEKFNAVADKIAMVVSRYALQALRYSYDV